MSETLKQVLSPLAVILAFAVPAAAQDAPRAELSGGYQYMQAKGPGESDYEKFKKGWYGEVAGNVTPMVGIVGNFGGNYKTLTDGSDSVDFGFHEFLVGIRVNGRRASMVAVPFGQVLVGGVRLRGSQGSFSVTENFLGLSAGAGVNLMPNGGNVGLRLGIDYLRVKSGGASSEILSEGSLNGFRFTAGVVVGIG